mmetsp:Transcript_27960/g.64528  ORF Transcript_27960/g.64528 Transcript_27960/m.64528 type:complete len:300 (+) Transcript_27960:56-955(+)
MGNCEVGAGEGPTGAGVEGVTTKGSYGRAQERGEALRLGLGTEIAPVLKSTRQTPAAVGTDTADTTENAVFSMDNESDDLDQEARGHEVWLHVYDLEPVTARLNESLKNYNLGAFHCGVEVLADEWFFAWGDSDQSGVVWNFPKGHQVHIYRESVFMGESPLNADAINEVLLDVMSAWPGNSYHPITRNCVTFAEELVLALKVPEAFPPWVRGAVDVGKNPALLPIANLGWRWVEWYCKRKQDEENAEHAAFEAAQHAAERRAYLEEMQSPADDSKQPAAAGALTSGTPTDTPAVAASK